MAERVTTEQRLSDVDKKLRLELQNAVKKSDIEAVSALLQHGLHLNTMVHKELPLVEAARQESVELVGMLLDAGADPNKCETVYDNYGGLYINRCALHECAARPGKGPEIARMLLEKGADRTILEDDEGRDVMETAVIFKNIRFIEVLLEYGAGVNELSLSGEMPLHHACLDGCVEVAQFLIARGAEVNPSNTHSPLVMAADRGRKEMVEFLVSKGADPNHKDDRGQTPLLQACYRGYLDIIKVLMDAGADLSTTSASGDTCVHFVCYQYPNKVVLQYLVAKGANLYAENNDGKTAFSQACLLARVDSVVALLSAGFDLQKQQELQPGICLQVITLLPAIRVRTHPKKTTLIAELLVAMGYTIPTVASIKQIRGLQSSSELTQQVCDWLIEQKTTPLSLKNQLRLYIRKLLGLDVTIDAKIGSLPLPGKIQEYLRFEDLTKRETKDRCLGCNEYMDECECQAEDFDNYEDYEPDWGSAGESDEEQ